MISLYWLNVIALCSILELALQQNTASIRSLDIRIPFVHCRPKVSNPTPDFSIGPVMSRSCPAMQRIILFDSCHIIGFLWYKMSEPPAQIQYIMSVFPSVWVNGHVGATVIRKWIWTFFNLLGKLHLLLHPWSLIFQRLLIQVLYLQLRLLVSSQTWSIQSLELGRSTSQQRYVASSFYSSTSFRYTQDSS